MLWSDSTGNATLVLQYILFVCLWFLLLIAADYAGKHARHAAHQPKEHITYDKPNSDEHPRLFHQVFFLTCLCLVTEDHDTGEDDPAKSGNKWNAHDHWWTIEHCPRTVHKVAECNSWVENVEQTQQEPCRKDDFVSFAHVMLVQGLFWLLLCYPLSMLFAHVATPVILDIWVVVSVDCEEDE